MRLAAIIPAQSGQINIGGEGQLHLGAIGAVLAVGLVGSSGSIVPAMVVGAILLGGAWASIPAVLRVRLGVNEALVTLFLNYVAISLLQYLVHGPMRDPASHGWPMSTPLPDAAVLTPISGTRLHWGVLLVLIVTLVVVAALRFTRTGVELRAVGLNVRTASPVRIPVRWYWFGSLVCGGILAGLAGYYEIAGVQHRLRTDISLGFGYSGFSVAWMCRGQVFGCFFHSSVLVSGLISSSDKSSDYERPSCGQCGCRSRIASLVRLARADSAGQMGASACCAASVKTGKGARFVELTGLILGSAIAAGMPVLLAVLGEILAQRSGS